METGGFSSDLRAAASNTVMKEVRSCVYPIGRIAPRMPVSGAWDPKRGVAAAAADDKPPGERTGGGGAFLRYRGRPPRLFSGPQRNWGSRKGNVCLYGKLAASATTGTG